MNSKVIDVSHISEFEWDEGNSKKNEEKHGVVARECEEVFSNMPLIRKDEQHSLVENRYIAFGETNARRMLFIVFTLRGGNIRVISARDQDRKERNWYEQTIADTSIQ